MSVNNILKNSEQVKYIAKTTLNNTIIHANAYDDQVGGLFAIGELNPNITYKTNAHVTLSNDRVPETETTLQLIGHVEAGLEIPEPNTTGFGVRTYGNLQINNVDNIHNLKLRKFKGAKVEVSVGGLINKGSPAEDNMIGSDFEPYITGIFGKQNTSQSKVDIGLVPKSGDLDSEFPHKSHQYGKSKGKTQPYIVGRATTKPDSVEDGLWLFHSDDIESTQDEELPVAYWHKGVSYPMKGDYKGDGTKHSYDKFDYFESPAKPVNPLTTYSGSLINWAVVDGGLKADPSGTMSISASISDNAQLSTSGNNEFRVDLLESNDVNYNSGNFDWRILKTLAGSSAVNSVKEAPFSASCASISGDVQITEVGGRWFKLSGVGKSRISLKLNDGLIKGTKLVIRGARLPSQIIDNFSDSADSVSPEFVDSDNDVNHTLTYSVLNKNEISFDYENVGTGLSAGLKCAIWFELVEVYQPQEVTVTVAYNTNIEEQYLSFQADSKSNEVVSVSGAGQSVDVVLGNSYSYHLTDEIRTLSIKLLIGAGGGVFNFADIKFDNSANVEYGVYTSESNTLIVAPRPFDEHSPAITSSSMLVGFKDIGNNFSRKVKLKARIIDADSSIDSVSAYFRNFPEFGIGNSNFKNEKFEITRDFKEYEFYIEQRHSLDDQADPEGGPDRLFKDSSVDNYIAILKGGSENQDLDFKVEFEYIFTDYILGDYAKALREYEDSQNLYLDPAPIRVRNLNNDNSKNLRVHRVSNVFQHNFPIPFDYCIYDTTCHIKTPEEYEDIEGDFIGTHVNINSIASFRVMSELATGTDYIDCDFTGPRVGFMLDQRKPWFEHLKSFCASCNYITYQNLADDNIKVINRYKYGDQMSGPPIDSQIMANSSSIFNQGDRQQRYIVEYQKNYSNPAKTKSITSKLGYVGEAEEKTIESIFYYKSDNEDRAEAIFTDSMHTDLAETTLVGIGHDIEAAQVYEFVDPDLPSRVPCKITKKNHNANGNTDLTLKIYRP